MKCLPAYMSMIAAFPVCLAGSAGAAGPPEAVRHVKVYAAEGRFAGWPANHGIWVWGDEILTGFSRGTYKDRGPFHHIDHDRPEEFLLARSKDGGETWTFLATPEPDTGEGNPPSLLELPDGRLCLVYGVRVRPYGIRARLSADHGATWSDPVVLRDDGGSTDVGYVRSVVRPDGKIVAVYYYSDLTGPTRYVGATVWDPARERTGKPR